MSLENVAFNVHNMHDLEIYNSEIQSQNVDLLLHVVPPFQYMSTHIHVCEGILYTWCLRNDGTKWTTKSTISQLYSIRIYPSRRAFPNSLIIGENKSINEVAMSFQRTFASPTYFVVSAFLNQSLVGMSQRCHRTYLLWKLNFVLNVNNRKWMHIHNITQDCRGSWMSRYNTPPLATEGAIAH